MTTRELSAIATTIIVFAGTFQYIRLALIGKAKPVLASWIVLFVTTTLSFVTYLTSPRWSIVSNACNATGVLTIGSILIATIWINKKNGTLAKFSVFQKYCLVSAAVILIFWATLVFVFHGTGIIPNIMTQVLMLIGYAVTAEKLWHARGNNESYFTWWCILLGGVIGLYTGIISRDPLSMLFAGRTILGTSVLVALMYRADRKLVT